ncbi:putative lipid II flippase FtsW [Brevibacterium sp. HMSC07C04]|uniref:putative lipid II flippase FtsW n=1 Tax=Brevibacterium sp. HMSC07C04 TaxID=1581130 RepID=UPI0008A60FB5|nr:putative lipid II flippase FtsW [Brevibacterium sp. HMSC07C04]OFS25391.1 cell division protein FtsW [Brevibacterium sp. HMSC07C04]
MTGAAPSRRRGFRAQITELSDRWQRLLARKTATFYLILIPVTALTGVGLLMVLSASSVTSGDASVSSAFSVFLRQAIYAASGLALMFAVSFTPVKASFRLTYVVLILSLILQVLPLTPLGVSINGNRNWIRIGPVQIQPSEFVKIALVLFTARYMALMVRRPFTIKNMAGFLFFAGAAVVLVLAGQDLGTVMILFLVLGTALLVGGLPKRWIFGLAAIAAVSVAFFVMTSENRMTRVMAMLSGSRGEAGDPLGAHWQSDHGLYALASGGWLGVGLGASREKWSWLPEAHNDFIFAIIGEELGLLGAAAVIGLFALLGFGIYRLMVQTTSVFVQTASAAVFAWLIGQAGVNIAVVAGIAPVIGVPLPFVSYGGSSMLAALIAAGLLLSFARSETGVAAALAERRSRFWGSLTFLKRRS